VITCLGAVLHGPVRAVSVHVAVKPAGLCKLLRSPWASLCCPRDCLQPLMLISLEIIEITSMFLLLALSSRLQ